MPDLDTVIQAVRDSLSEDLLSAEWRRIVKASGNPDPMAGHCAVASEALYDLVGGAMAGYTPMTCSYYDDPAGKRHFAPAPEGEKQKSHWWLRGPKDGKRGQGDILDPTVSQYKKPFPYENGRGCGFQSQHPPSDRARIVVARVEEKLGKAEIAAFRMAQIVAFQHSGGQVKPTIATRRRVKELGLKFKI